jgi:geranylgeranyl reductase family protein
VRTSLGRSVNGAFDAEVIVVGAGPAGAATAARVAAAGHDVLIVDRRTFPRDKVCGDFVGPVALAELESLGIGDAPAIRDGNAAGRAALYVDGERLMTYVLPHARGLSPFGRVIPRVVLDEAILDAARRAGARTLEGHVVTGMDVSSDGVRVRTRGPGGEQFLRALVVVGADGSSSTVARYLRGGPAPRDDMLVAVRAYFENVDGAVDECDLHFSLDSFPGYAWIFPVSPGVANVGVGMMVDTFPPPAEHMRDLLLRLVRTNPGMRERLASARMVGKPEGWPLVTYDPRLVVVGERVLLVGDAAGLINPMNGEGIQYALSSARFAAETLNRCLDAGDCSRERFSAYERSLRDSLLDDMLLARLIVRTIANRGLNRLWLAILRAIAARARRDRAYARATGGVVAGVVPAREAIETPILVRSLEVVAAAVAAEARRLAREGPVFRALARACAPALEALCDSRGALAWARRVTDAARDLARSRRDRPHLGKRAP